MEATPAQQVVQKLWKFCNVLRDDGLSYPDYVEQLTYLLFLKMADEREKASPINLPIVPVGLGWDSLLARRSVDLHSHYGFILEVLGAQSGMLGIIFRRAKNKIQDPAKLQKLIVDLVDKETWTAIGADVKGEAYEGLLEKTAQDSKSGAGQYFTPRVIIDAIVEIVAPVIGETICDPACGTGGFLLSVHHFIRNSGGLLSSTDEDFLRLNALRGVELVDSVARLGAMNLFLHGIGPVADEAPTPITVEDSLARPSPTQFDVVLTNPPFGKKSSIAISNDDDTSADGYAAGRPDFIQTTANKQVNFLQHVYTMLKPSGRAAVVVPDNVLFEGGAAEVVRRFLFKNCIVHTLLRLPTGIFYAQSVKANVLFFDKRPPTEPTDKEILVYDLRSDVKRSLRANPLTSEDIQDFIHCCRSFRSASDFNRQRKRCRIYSYSELLKRDGFRLDIDWLDARGEDSETESIALKLGMQITEDLEAALAEIRAVNESLMS
jgi:type I restriction enzyme M protein